MRKLFTLKALLLLTGVMLAYGYASAQSVSPSGFPAYHDTGNPEKDAASYKAAKTAWLNANPGKESSLENLTFDQVRQAGALQDAPSTAEKDAIAKQPVQVKTLTVQEYNEMLKVRGEFVKANPHLFKVVDSQGREVNKF